jgi:hypothetical protein
LYFIKKGCGRVVVMSMESGPRNTNQEHGTTFADLYEKKENESIFVKDEPTFVDLYEPFSEIPTAVVQPKEVVPTPPPPVEENLLQSVTKQVTVEATTTEENSPASREKPDLIVENTLDQVLIKPNVQEEPSIAQQLPREIQKQFVRISPADLLPNVKPGVYVVDESADPSQSIIAPKSGKRLRLINEKDQGDLLKQLRDRVPGGGALSYDAFESSPKIAASKDAQKKVLAEETSIPVSPVTKYRWKSGDILVTEPSGRERKATEAEATDIGLQYVARTSGTEVQPSKDGIFYEEKAAPQSQGQQGINAQQVPPQSPNQQQTPSSSIPPLPRPEVEPRVRAYSRQHSSIPDFLQKRPSFFSGIFRRPRVFGIPQSAIREEQASMESILKDKKKQTSFYRLLSQMGYEDLVDTYMRSMKERGAMSIDDHARLGESLEEFERRSLLAEELRVGIRGDEVNRMMQTDPALRFLVNSLSPQRAQEILRQSIEGVVMGASDAELNDMVNAHRANMFIRSSSQYQALNERIKTRFGAKASVNSLKEDVLDSDSVLVSNTFNFIFRGHLKSRSKETIESLNANLNTITKILAASISGEPDIEQFVAREAVKHEKVPESGSAGPSTYSEAAEKAQHINMDEILKGVPKFKEDYARRFGKSWESDTPDVRASHYSDSLRDEEKNRNKQRKSWWGAWLASLFSKLVEHTQTDPKFKNAFAN